MIAKAVTGVLPFFSQVFSKELAFIYIYIYIYVAVIYMYIIKIRAGPITTIFFLCADLLTWE